MNFFLCVIGMVFIIEGMPWFLSPEKMKTMMMAMLEQDDTLLRKLGVALMAVGLLLVYLGKN